MNQFIGQKYLILQPITIYLTCKKFSNLEEDIHKQN